MARFPALVPGRPGRICGLMTGGVGLAVALTAAGAPPGPVTNYPGEAYAVSAGSASDGWGVGITGNSGPLIMHWNGTSWARAAAPHQPNAVPDAVAAVSPADAWAVGTNYVGGANEDLALHWDGSKWTQVTVPSPGKAPVKDNLWAIGADSATDAWAAGSYGTIASPSGGASMMHWNGHRWSQVSVPSPGSQGELLGVAAVSPTDAWAVGDYITNGGADHILLVHWDGTSWTRVAGPESITGGGLTAVTALSPTDIWAVGSYWNKLHFTRSLVLHWDGTTWAQVASPSPGGTAALSITQLKGVSAVSPTDVWAVGYYGHYASGFYLVAKTLVLHWDGKRWTRVASPAAGNSSGLTAVTALSPTDGWAVGGVFARARLGHTLILHWNGKAWTRA